MSETDFERGLIQARRKYEGEIQGELDTIRARPPAPYEPPQKSNTPAPYDSPGAALADLTVRICGAIAVGVTAFGVWRIGMAFAAAAADAVGAWCAANAGLVTAVVFGVAGIAAAASARMANGGETPTKSQATNARQTNINITVNAAGESVTVNKN